MVLSMLAINTIHFILTGTPIAYYIWRRNAIFPTYHTTGFHVMEVFTRGIIGFTLGWCWRRIYNYKYMSDAMSPNIIGPSMFYCKRIRDSSNK